MNPSNPPPPDPAWKACTCRANHWLQQGSHQQAEAEYRQALALAETLLQTARVQLDNAHAIHVYAISCHNLATVYTRLECDFLAEGALLAAHGAAVGTLDDIGLPHAFRWEALCALRANMFQLIDFYRGRGRKADRDAIVERSTASAVQFLSTLQPP
ncbi:DUF2753 domain-containing protein [Gloeobacter morelensis]|uniref:DUF2753 family protein n=1 Tax=Gloeobacter morelensis MG652769 TaxID=2781736 RepID=A0ABY3PMC7_9CYAN|nr:DUF2753 domain-containing protein [Gloeobacter morelensis]UFP94759.1 DUF2753 family protein [Gloeobacter morelensis MG652769]